MDRTKTFTAEPSESAVTIRVSTAEDGDAESIRHLASLEDREAPHGPVVLAELDGKPVAALGIAGGDAVADPVRASREILALLRLRRLETRLIGAVWGV